jgi:2'-5' RNA ligase
VTTQRTFIALDLPPAMREAVVSIQETLGIRQPDLRFTAQDNLHLTLKFLGEITAPATRETEERLQRMQPGPLRIRLAGAGCFSPRIVWLAIRGADALQQQVDEALVGLYAPEQRFMGHVTIARTRRMPDRLRRAVESLEVPDLEAQVTSFSLQASHLGQTGTHYETLAEFGLHES